MLDFRKTNILISGIYIIMLVVYGYFPFALAYFLLPLLLWSAVVFYGCYNIEAGFFIRIKCHGDIAEKTMALTFDDGPSKEYTPAILDILKKQEVKATFFCIGRHVEGNEKLMKRIHEEGHTIGNHSFSHDFWFDLFSVKRMKEDLKSFDAIVHSMINVTPRMFRPPFGVTNPRVRDVIQEGNYFPVGWNIRSMDTVITNSNRLMNRVVSRFKPGAIILFHDSKQVTVEILDEIIRESREQGYQLVTVDQLLKIKPYE